MRSRCNGMEGCRLVCVRLNVCDWRCPTLNVRARVSSSSVAKSPRASRTGKSQHDISRCPNIGKARNYCATLMFRESWSAIHPPLVSLLPKL